MDTQVPRFGQFLSRVLNANGPAMLDVLPAMVPVLPMDTDRADLLACRDEFLFSSFDEGVASAAQFPTVWLGTSDSSILVLEQFTVQSSIAQRIRISTTPNFPGAMNTAAQVLFDDTRLLAARFSGRHLFTSEAILTVPPALRMKVNLAAGVPQTYSCRLVLTGFRKDGTGSAFRIQGETAGVTSDLFVSARGYGRNIENSETFG